MAIGGRPPGRANRLVFLATFFGCFFGNGRGIRAAAATACSTAACRLGGGGVELGRVIAEAMFWGWCTAPGRVGTGQNWVSQSDTCDVRRDSGGPEPGGAFGSICIPGNGGPPKPEIPGPKPGGGSPKLTDGPYGGG